MKKYSSKIGFGLVFFILAIVVGSTIPMIWPPIWLGLIVNILLVIFVAYLYETTYYLIDGNFLIINSGLLVNKEININRIKNISETHNPLSAPAASLDRLEITYDEYGRILISPKDKSGFIDQIIRENPQIKVHYKSVN